MNNNNPHHQFPFNSDTQKHHAQFSDSSRPFPPPPPRLSRIPSIPNQPDSGPVYSHRGSYDASPYFSPQASQSSSYFPGQTQQPASYLAGTQTQQQYTSYLAGPAQPYYGQSGDYSIPEDNMARLRNRPQVNYSDDAYSTNEFNERVAPQQRIPPQPQPIMSAPLPVQQPLQQAQPVASIPQAMPQHNLPQVEVKTKFPVARIKRIMQLDEDIGKVAQATPTAVAKSLELFMIDLVAKGAANAKDQGSKRVTATHLKNSLLADPQYDFLSEICENIPDENVKKSRAKSEAKSDSDDEDITAAAAPKKKKAGGKRKKAGGDDSD
ncbi:hypothetical protein LTS08_003302 [Lithohypha guttulata]|nr:hypothetical protein LTS08_003302 [Lithohypha guttulata]